MPRSPPTPKDWLLDPKPVGPGAALEQPGAHTQRTRRARVRQSRVSLTPRQLLVGEGASVRGTAGRRHYAHFLRGVNRQGHNAIVAKVEVRHLLLPRTHARTHARTKGGQYSHKRHTCKTRTHPAGPAHQPARRAHGRRGANKGRAHTLATGSAEGARSRRAPGGRGCPPGPRAS